MTSKSMRLSVRLFLAFGAIVLLALLSSGVALLKLKEIDDNLSDIVNDNNVKIALNQQMSESVHIVARVMRSLMLLTDDTAMAEENKKIVAARAAYDKARAELDKFKPSEAGQAKRAAIDAAAAKARPLNTRVIDLGMAKKPGEATPLLMGEAAPATQTWQAALDDNIQFQTKNNVTQYEEAEADYAAARNLLIGIALASTVFGAVLAIWLVRGIVKELGGEPADVGALARSIADADLSTTIHVRPGDTTSVVAAMARMQASLSSVVSTVRGNAESVATASSQIAQGNTDLSQRTEEQASALQQTAATMDELGSTVRNNADNAKQANQLALGASGVAAKGGAVVGQVVDTMKGINDSSKKIADIIGVIDGIAFQTNILALNAAVEAARAGEQGRGFAVVAGEVRTLAQRSAEAAKEIKGLIQSSVEQVDQGTALVDQAGHTMQEIVGAIKRVTDIVGEISAASAEQSAGVSQVGQAVSQMDQVTQQNAALVEESAAAAESLKQQAQQLVQTVAVFKVGQGDARTNLPAPVAAPLRTAAITRFKPAAAATPKASPAPARVATAAAPSAAPSAAPVSAPITTAKTGTDDWETF